MKNKNECLINMILIVVIFVIVLSNNDSLKRFGNKITSGKMNTILIVIIIGLLLTENLKMGFYLAIIYLFLLVRFNKNIEGFKSIPGYSPLNCKTYGDSRKKTGSAFYPLHAK